MAVELYTKSKISRRSTQIQGYGVAGNRFLLSVRLQPPTGEDGSNHGWRWQPWMLRPLHEMTRLGLKETVKASAINSYKQSGPYGPGRYTRFACDICGKQFKSYQALGGHKSHHGLKFTSVYMEPEGLDCTGQPSVAGGEEEKGMQSLHFTIDLNQLPPESSCS